MTRLLIAAGLGLAAVLIGMLLSRSRPTPPITVRPNQLPTHISHTKKKNKPIHKNLKIKK